MKTVKDIDVKGKRVLVRVDFNEPLDEQGNPLDDYRLRSTIPTLKYLLDQGCTLVLMTHVGRPDGRVTEKYRVTGVARQLERLIGRPVKKLADCVGPEVRSALGNREAKIYFLENLRFHPEEEKNDDAFAQELARNGEFYVNDAFANCHREHASMTGILKYLPGAAGLLLEKEVRELTAVRDNPEHPFTFILGGAKLETKLKLLKTFVQLADHVLIGGEIANTLLKASGAPVGASKISGAALSEAVTLVPKISDAKLIIPIDVSVSKELEKEEPQAKPKDARNCAVREIGPDEIIYDIGPRTVKKYAEIIARSKLVLWNGPMGYFEHMHFRSGTKGIVQALAATSARTVVGGGETVDFLDEMKIKDKLSFVSTGGGAMLDFLADGHLIAIDALGHE